MSSKTESPLLSLADARTHANAGKRSLQEKRKILAVLVLLALSFGFFCRHDTSSDYEHKQKVIFGVHPRVYTKWAMYAPWHAADTYKPPPEGCVVTQVNLLQRHGARRPSEKDVAKYTRAVNKAISVKENISHDSPLEFVKHYEYKLDKEDLVPFGAEQSNILGEIDFKRYHKFLGHFNSSIPFVRAHDVSRVVNSAGNWTKGFARASGNVLTPKLDLAIPGKLNNTLADVTCPNGGNGTHEQNTWIDQWAPRVVARLNAAAPGAGFDNRDIYPLMSICAIETQVEERESAWCKLFDEVNWRDFEYAADVEKFYKTGYGEPLGPVQGVGWVNELLARLTHSPVHDHTQTNRTLDAHPRTFPLERAFYADFSHENTIVAVVAAMRLFNDGRPLDPLVPNPARTWRASAMIPFSARLVVERLECPPAVPKVRVLMNDAVIPMDCADAEGLCTLEEFINGQGYARVDGAGDWEKCFA